MSNLFFCRILSSVSTSQEADNPPSPTRLMRHFSRQETRTSVSPDKTIISPRKEKEKDKKNEALSKLIKEEESQTGRVSKKT